MFRNRLQKDVKRVVAGKQAKRRGDYFERILENQAEAHGWHVLKILMGCRQVSAQKLIRQKNPFDFVFVKQNRVIFADAKTTKNKTFTFSALKPHQVRDLLECEKHGFAAGYIVNFSSMDLTVFFKGSQLASLQSGGSLGIEDGILLGMNYIINLGRLFHNNVTQQDVRNA